VEGTSVHTDGEVRRRLADLVRAESAGAVLSDDALTTLLRAEGVDIARRTVAKYRKCMGIPSSHLRRKAAASGRAR
jgi:RNA polymerase sigma-54 factor